MLLSNIAVEMDRHNVLLCEQFSYVKEAMRNSLVSQTWEHHYIV